MPGEIAEMMLEGMLCAGCGEFIGEGDGFPTYCSPECARYHGAEHWQGGMLCEPAPKPYACDACGKAFRTRGARRQHKRDAHKGSE